MAGVTRAKAGFLKCIKCGFFICRKKFHVFDSGFISRTCDDCRVSKTIRKYQREEDCRNDISDDQRKVKNLLERVW